MSIRCPHRGFSLIEVLISLAIIGAILVLFQAVLRSVPLARYAKDQDLALKIASNEIEGLRALGYASLPVSGAFSDSQLSSLPASFASATVSDFNSKTKQIVVAVSWKEPGNASSYSVSLATLVTQVGGLK